MRILIISLYYAPEITGNAPIVSRLAEMLAARGCEVEVIAGTPHYRLPEVPPRYRRRLLLHERINGVDITRCYSYPKSDGVKAKVLNYLTFWATALVGSLRTKRPDVVMVVTPPFLLAGIGAMLRLLRGSKFVYNAQDLFPESYVASGVIESSWVPKLMNRFQLGCLKHCDAIAVITESFRQNFLGKQIKNEKLVVIPNFADTEQIKPEPKDNEFSREHGLNDKFVVMYAGNIGYTHGADIIVPVAARFQSRPDIQFVVVGDGSGRPALQARVREAGLNNMLLLPPQPQERVSQMLASADVGFVTTLPGAASASFPSRIYGLMAAARPIVASINLESDAAQLLRIAHCGLSVSPGDVDGMCTNIAVLRENTAMRLKMGALGREHLLRGYLPEQVAAKYEALFRRMVSGTQVETASTEAAA